MPQLPEGNESMPRLILNFDLKYRMGLGAENEED